MTQKQRDFAALLQAWRKAKGLSQAGAALELKVNKRTLQDWEQRRCSPLLDAVTPVLRRLAADGFNL